MLLFFPHSASSYLPITDCVALPANRLHQWPLILSFQPLLDSSSFPARPSWYTQRQKDQTLGCEEMTPLNTSSVAPCLLAVSGTRLYLRVTVQRRKRPKTTVRKSTIRGRVQHRRTKPPDTVGAPPNTPPDSSWCNSRNYIMDFLSSLASAQPLWLSTCSRHETRRVHENKMNTGWSTDPL